MSMTRQEQLDSVVRNYGEWPKQPYLKFAVWNKPESRVCFFNQSYASQLDEPAFTRAEVEARKAELQNKPSWDDAPEWAGYLSQDGNGVWFWNEDLPDIMEIEFLSTAGRMMTSVSGEVIGDWRDTLEKRPAADDKPTLEEEEAFNMLESRNSDEVFGKNLPVYTARCAEWNGEGLPPAGVECEYKHPDFGWTGCSTIGIFQGKMVVAPNGGGFYQASKEELRPIKSDREQWVEDCEEFISGYATWEAAAAAIHDALLSGKLKMPEVE